MAYGNVNTPSFYINIPEYLKHVGVVENLNPIFLTIPNTLPPSDTPIDTLIVDDLERKGNFTYGSYFDTTTYVILLGHKMGTKSSTISVYYDCETDDDGNYIIPGTSESLTSLFNGGTDGLAPAHDNFSIYKVGGYPVDNAIITCSDNTTGCKQVIISDKYTFPVSCDLKMNMSIRMDGIKSTKSPSGIDLVNYKYLGPSKWGGEFYPFEVESPGTSFPRNGRREWSLSWNDLTESQLLPEYYAGAYDGLTDSNGTSAGSTSSGDLVDSSSSFFSKVLHKTMGGKLPMVMQIDKDNYNADQFALVRIKMNSIKIQQTSNKIYRINLKIEECW